MAGALLGMARGRTTVAVFSLPFICTVSLSTRRTSATFFFSSRRRHTRFDCDWSSDVCSSDLLFRLACSSGYFQGFGQVVKILGMRCNLVTLLQKVYSLVVMLLLETNFGKVSQGIVIAGE